MEFVKGYLVQFKKSRNIEISNRTSISLCVFVIIFLSTYLVRTGSVETLYKILLGVPVLILALATLTVTSKAEAENDLLAPIPKVSKMQIPADYLSVVFVSLILFTGLIYFVFCNIRHRIVKCISEKSGNKIDSPNIIIEVSAIVTIWIIGIVYYSARFAGIGN